MVALSDCVTNWDRIFDTSSGDELARFVLYRRFEIKALELILDARVMNLESYGANATSCFIRENDEFGQFYRLLHQRQVGTQAIFATPVAWTASISHCDQLVLEKCGFATVLKRPLPALL